MNLEGQQRRRTAALIILAITVLATAAHARERRLLKHSTRIAILSTPDKKAIFPSKWIGEYLWLSGREILLLRQHVGGSLVIVEDVITHKSRSLAVFDNPLWGNTITHIRLSPDRKRLLWFVNGNELHVATLTGSEEFTIPLVDPRSDTALWLADSRHWVDRRYPVYRDGNYRQPKNLMIGRMTADATAAYRLEP